MKEIDTELRVPCNGKEEEEPKNEVTTVSSDTQTQSCPFNLTPLSLLSVYCLIIFLTSSLYYNWPVMESIMIEDRVFESLCTEEERAAAVVDTIICDKQRKAINDLTSYVFYSEFFSYGVIGPLTDKYGLYFTMMVGYIFGFLTFIIMFTVRQSNIAVNISFSCWGLFGGCVFITSAHLARMFPDTTSLADGMIIFFDNLCAILPIIIHQTMRKYKLRYYEAFGFYLLWGIVPSFLIALMFLPFEIHSPSEIQEYLDKLAEPEPKPILDQEGITKFGYEYRKGKKVSFNQFPQNNGKLENGANGEAKSTNGQNKVNGQVNGDDKSNTSPFKGPEGSSNGGEETKVGDSASDGGDKAKGANGTDEVNGLPNGSGENSGKGAEINGTDNDHNGKDTNQGGTELAETQDKADLATDDDDKSDITVEEEEDPNSLWKKLADSRLWLNLIVFSIPVNCAIYYRKMFSTYFHYNQKLIKLFPILLLFVFVPTPFIAVLNQFIGIHMTSSIIYALYICSFFCFFSNSHVYGIISIIFFGIGSSSGEQQTMSYISEHHSEHESTLMGISYGIGFFLGTALQYLLDRIYKYSPRAAIYVIAVLLGLAIFYSVITHIRFLEGMESEETSYRIINILMWFIPFIFLCFSLTINSIYNQRKVSLESFNRKVNSFYKHDRQKILTGSIVFFLFSFYYASNIFMVLIAILRFSKEAPLFNEWTWSIIFYVCFFIAPHILVYGIVRKIRHVNIVVIVTFLSLFKLCLLFVPYVARFRFATYAFPLFLCFYGLAFFLFINTMAYYNFKITYVERTYRNSILHWGFKTTMLFALRFMYNLILNYRISYQLSWIFVFGFFIFFSTILVLYIPYEVDTFFDIRLVKLPCPAINNFDKEVDRLALTDHFFTRIVNNSLVMFGLGLLLNINTNIYLLTSFTIISMYNVTVVTLSVFKDDAKTLSDFGVLDVTFTVFGVLTFLALATLQVFYRDYKLSENRLYGILASFYFIITSMASNNSWFRTQVELQRHYCSRKGDSCGICRCCCSHKSDSNKCFCHESPVYGKYKTCDCHTRIKCFARNCKCAKKIIMPDYTIAFYEISYKEVDTHYLSFFIETIFGCLLFLFYLSLSKIDIKYYQC